MAANNDEITKKRIAQLAPYRFKKGQSGNPSGRPKGIVGKALERELLKTGQLAAVIAGIIARAKKGDPQAFNSIRDTVDGKPTQAIEHGGKDGGPLELVIKHIGSPYQPPAETK